MMLADALLRRKELKDRVDRIGAIKRADVFEMKVARKQLTDTVDDIRAEVPRLDLNQVTHEYDYYARQLRLIDAAIQQLNWTTEINVEDVWQDLPVRGAAAS